MTFLKLIEKLIVRLNIILMVLSLAAMVVLGLIQVVLRNIFDSGLIWADIVIRNLVLWVGFSGAVVATSKGHHIAIGALLKFVPEGAKRVAHVLVSIFTSVICFCLAYTSITFLLSEKEMGGVLFGKIPLWISELIIPATFCFLTYQFFVHALEAPPVEEGEGL